MRRLPVSVRVSIYISWVLGCVSLLFGTMLVVTAVTAWGPVRSSMLTASEGIRSAESAISLIGADFGTSSSLVSQVSNSIRSTADVIHETWGTMRKVQETGEDIRSLVFAVRTSIEELPLTVSSMLGRDHFTEVLNELTSTYYTTGEVLVDVQVLTSTLPPVESLLVIVADGVDSLAADLFTTEEAFSEATLHLINAAEAVESTAGSPAIPLMVGGFGLIPILVGVHLLVQAVALRKLYLRDGPSGETSSSL